METDSKERDYSRSERRINIVGGVIFLALSGASVLVATQVLDAPWTAWWLIPGGFSFGLVVALAISMIMEYRRGKAYERIDVPLWRYALIRFRFLFVLFIVPTALALLAGIVYFSVVPAGEDSPLVRWIVPRALGFAVIILFAGLALPYLFRRAAGAEKTQSQKLRSIVDEVAGEMGMSVQGVYEAPLDGLGGANAAQMGFIQGRKSVFVLGEWEKHFTEAEIKALVAHEFAHAERNHIGKLLALTVLCRIGVPALLFLFAGAAIEVFDIPKPPPTWAVVVISTLAAAIVTGSHLLPRRVGRTFETAADSAAAQVAGAPAMVSALEKLAELNLIPKERQHPLSTHPSVEDRIQALRA